MRRPIFPVMLFLLVINYTGDAQVITTVAGTGTCGCYGDGGPAYDASLLTPFRARPDTAGNIFIADDGDYRIRKVSAAGIITTIAGNGSGMHSGDGIPATAAGLSITASVDVDRVGNIYIAENNYSVGGLYEEGAWIRKVDNSGNITTIAGNGAVGYGGDGGPATNAQFRYVYDLAVDPEGNIFIADGLNACVRKINTAGIIVTVAGTPNSPGYSGDGGPATAARIYFPNSIAVDNAGNLYITDRDVYNVRKVSAAGIISTIAGNETSGYGGDGGPATAAELTNPTGIAADDSGNVYIADYDNTRIRKINASGIISTIAGTGSSGYSPDGGLATASALSAPWGVAVDSRRNVYIANIASQDNRIRMILGPGVAALTPSVKADNEDELRIYPNPGDRKFVINEKSTDDEQMHLVVSNFYGQKIIDITAITNRDIEMSLDEPAGIYFVSAITANRVQFGKLVIR